MYQKHCPGCFHDKGGAPACPVCGYDESATRSPLFLPHGIIIGGQYRVGRVLGRPGGFGITYLGWDINLQQRVAIKEFLPREIATRHAGGLDISVHTEEDRPNFDFGKDQFLREARIVARFDHPNVVRVRNYFNGNGTAYLVMDYYEGMSLGEYLAAVRTQIEPPLAVPLIRPVLEGLQYVHERGVLHRDLKPHNIYLASIGKPIILDFGAARQAAGDRVQSMSVVLTEGYAPLEQYQRRAVQGPWTDVYGAAAVLYRMLTGQAPPIALDRLGHDPVEIGGWAGVPAVLRPALARALAVKPEDRFQSAAEFLAVLADYRESYVAEPEPAPPPEAPPPVPMPAPQPEPATAPHEAVELPPSVFVPPVDYQALPHRAPSAVAVPPLPAVEPPAAAPAAPSRPPAPRAAPRPIVWSRLAIPAVLLAALVLLALTLWPQREAPSPAPPASAAVAAAPALPAAAPAAEPLLLPALRNLPAGSFRMGEGADAQEQRVDAFLVGQAEVTVEQFEQFVRLARYANPLWANYPCESAGGRLPTWENPGYVQSPQHPVVCVSWADAQAYVDFLSRSTAQPWRLPTEAEWEYAARGGSADPFWWGGAYDPARASCAGCPEARTAPQAVGNWPPNAFGLHETAANVREWTCSLFQPYGSQAQTRCAVPEEQSRIAVRGGSWHQGVETLRSAHRDGMEPQRRNAWTGFRVVQGAAPAP